VNRTPRVLVADDHEPMRVGVRDALERGGCVVCAEAEDAYTAVDLAVQEKPDVCLLDIAMPGSGLWALREIRKRVPEAHCVMLTVSDDSRDLFDALLAGAEGYLLKDVAAEALPVAIRAVAQGDAALSGELTARVLHEFRHGKGRSRQVTNTEGRRVEFTSREWDVLELLLEDASTAEIAERLFVRPITVRRHIADAMHKLRVNSRAEAVQALRTGSVVPRQRDDRPR
jgi:DNA-binding NarL/FixJ family response regulator